MTEVLSDLTAVNAEGAEMDYLIHCLRDLSVLRSLDLSPADSRLTHRLKIITTEDTETRRKPDGVLEGSELSLDLFYRTKHANKDIVS